MCSSDLVLRDVAYRSSDSSAKWSLATIADLDIYPGVLLAPRATPSPAAPNLAAMDEAMRAQAVEGLSVGFASFVIDDVAATSQMPGPNGASRTVATYARRVATEGFTPGRLDTATVEDLKVTSDGAEILTAEAATLADIDIVAALRRILEIGRAHV